MVQKRSASDWAALGLGGLMIVIGIVLAAGGAWLIVLGGSIYYLPAGIGLMASGTLIALRRAEGAWLYLLLFTATLIWAWWEVGTNGWALVPRTVGPSLLLIAVIFITPKLRTYHYNYEAPAT